MNESKLLSKKIYIYIYIYIYITITIDIIIFYWILYKLICNITRDIYTFPLKRAFQRDYMFF
ncbi:MAG: hypothetical protein N7Q72_04405, partial [Spiroplasma sp. Tabriz.8]|nr:hypothetical protein [Spiroplasma sp. Tabriz.8]